MQKVQKIGGFPARDYIDKVARTDSGNFLDHNVRVNSVVSSYQISDATLSQRPGDLAASLVLKQTSLLFTLIPDLVIERLMRSSSSFIHHVFVSSSGQMQIQTTSNLSAQKMAEVNQISSTDVTQQRRE